LHQRMKNLLQDPRKLPLLFLAMNLAVLVASLILLRPAIAMAEGTSAVRRQTSTSTTTTTTTIAQPESLMAAAVAMAGSAIGSGLAVYGAASAGAAAIAERPSVATWIIILAGLGEGIAIYGLIIAIVIIGKA